MHIEKKNLYDVVIRNGKIIDGSGTKPFIGDIAINEGTISLIGEIKGSGNKEIDAKGNLVTPGWVDVHTHYDGQVCWDPYLTPSSWAWCHNSSYGKLRGRFCTSQTWR